MLTISAGQSGEGVLFGSGLSLVGCPHDLCETNYQSVLNGAGAPIVARGSSPARATSPSFPPDL
jgi:hypothetical protein